jgi:dinuclear metal center YbgI/SA1388 family protein
MKTPKIADIAGIINKIAPPSLAETWDNVGLQIGDPAAGVSGIMVALEPSPAVIDSALSSSCQLLVTHHPLIFKPLKNISAALPHGALIHKAIKGGLAVIAMHTNYDSAIDGLNDLLAEKIGLGSCQPLSGVVATELVKLAAFVPIEHLETVRTALLPFAAPLGNYRDCSFAAEGTGTFTPLAGAAPFCGTLGELAKVSEQRLEILVERLQLPKAVKALLAAHPYEVPAFDLYPLLNEGSKTGLGRIGTLDEPITLAEYAAHIRNALAAPLLRYVGDPARKIKKVALCSGSGASLLREAARAGADVLVTGDVKYHEARDAEDLGLALIDAGHFPTEIIMATAVAGRLGQALANGGYAPCRVETCAVEKDPFRL